MDKEESSSSDRKIDIDARIAEIVDNDKKEIKVEEEKKYRTKIDEKNQVEFAEELSADTIDIVFCLDVTGSMSKFISRTKEVIKNMIDYFQRVTIYESKFGIVAYRDHPPEEKTFITKIHNISTPENALKFLEELRASGGGDTPEAVLQGLMDSIVGINWRSTPIVENEKELSYQRILIHVGDAPAHGREFHEESVDDRWPEGCPSKITGSMIANALKEFNIHYQFCRLTNITDKMMNAFEKIFEKFEVIDLVFQKDLDKSYKEEFDKYKVSKGNYKGKEWDAMSASEKQEVMYEHEVTKTTSKKIRVNK